MANSPAPSVKIAALYQFTRFDDPAGVRDILAERCRGRGIAGTLLVAHEGLNGTIAGSDAAIDAILSDVRALPGCSRINVKFSRAATSPFARMKVRLKREIVTMGEPDLDPRSDAGKYVDPADWNALIDDPDTIIIDTRNDYEVALGMFEGAINPGTRTFGEFPAWFRRFRSEREQHGGVGRIAMFCTGGIRCEKATAFLKREGVTDVLHLEGGILEYLNKTPPDASRWRGECFVFDQRVTVTGDLAPGYRTLCPQCQRSTDDNGCAECASSTLLD